MDAYAASVQKLPAPSLFSVSVHHNLKWLFPPNIVWALVPAVAASLKNTVSAFKPIKKPKLTHNPFTVPMYHAVTLLVCGSAFPSLSAPYRTLRAVS
jgi:hypothetical protein